jgi:hypothetical protein
VSYARPMTDEPESPGMIGPSPSERGLPAIPADPAEHAARSAREWRDVAESYVGRRMRELGIPEHMIGASDPEYGIKRAAFMPHDREGGNVTTGITVNSGCLNPALLKGKKGGRLWPRASLRDRIDSIIAHEWAESRSLDHGEALKAAARTDLPVRPGAWRILRAMSRSPAPSPPP